METPPPPQHRRRGRESIVELQMGRRHADGPLHQARTYTKRANGLSTNCPVPWALSLSTRHWRKVNGQGGDLTWEIYRDTLIRTMRAGSGLLHHPCRHTPPAMCILEKRFIAASGVGGGDFTSKWCLVHDREPL